MQVADLTINARDLMIFPTVLADGEGEEMRQAVIIADAIDTSKVQNVTLRDVSLSVSFPGMQSYPWTEYAVVPVPAPNEQIYDLRRRARKILTAFRSHSKGGLVRLAAKIDHERMMKKGDLGPHLVERLLIDHVLELFRAGKYYLLRQDRMAQLLQMDYQALQKQQWTAASDAYLEGVLGDYAPGR
jgi:hypothetical protein